MRTRSVLPYLVASAVIFVTGLVLGAGKSSDDTSAANTASKILPRRGTDRPDRHRDPRGDRPPTRSTAAPRFNRQRALMIRVTRLVPIAIALLLPIAAVSCGDDNSATSTDKAAFCKTTAEIDAATADIHSQADAVAAFTKVKPQDRPCRRPGARRRQGRHPSDGGCCRQRPLDERLQRLRERLVGCRLTRHRELLQLTFRR